MRVLDDQGRLLKQPQPHECEDCQGDPPMPKGFASWADWHVDHALDRYEGPVGSDELADALDAVLGDETRTVTRLLARALDMAVQQAEADVRGLAGGRRAA